ncbi:hypothetical protein F5Y14DRAFT_457528 [Nemania sp. NC0429]|nr:hypothetical protein F5Y14DRAFT_457528 [Nemania sp. NC0429]
MGFFVQHFVPTAVVHPAPVVVVTPPPPPPPPYPVFVQHTIPVVPVIPMVPVVPVVPMVPNGFLIRRWQSLGFRGRNPISAQRKPLPSWGQFPQFSAFRHYSQAFHDAAQTPGCYPSSIPAGPVDPVAAMIVIRRYILILSGTQKRGHEPPSLLRRYLFVDSPTKLDHRLRLLRKRAIENVMPTTSLAQPWLGPLKPEGN